MATLKVASPFTVQLDPVPPPDAAMPHDPSQPAPKRARKGIHEAEAVAPTTYIFPSAGTYEDVPDEVANHWYTASHLEDYEPPEMNDVAGVVVMVPVPEVVTAEEADTVLTAEQKAQIRSQRAAEAKAAKAAEHHRAQE